MNSPIRLENITKRFPGESKPALHNASLTIEPGEFVVIVGPSGSGKSTLIEIICGLVKPDSGHIESPASVAMVFQSGALFPWLTASQNIEIALTAKQMDARAVKTETRQALTLVGLEHFGDRLPRDLSGGQRQRVGLARALAVEPDLLILDEPFSALDIQTTELLHRDLLKIWQETKKTILMVSHSIEEAVTLADRVAVLKAGQITHEFKVDIKRPRREQQLEFIHDVQKIRRELLD